ncbi:DNA ligase D [Chitinophaga filiformis]|uniref:DNA ligase D n=1 Tax=Chitinophaga filiformis TaxID=104663 RepID=UPI001F352C81|nr:DNA ligase D [Chitinophaga filiformis]MCF6404616.1 DNA ligase D [Chitinophaga filiformis]
MVAKRRSKKGDEMPHDIVPMLCTLVEKPPASEEYLYEVKWDGYRIIAYVSDANVTLRSRGGQDYTAKYPLVVRALAQLGHDAVLDGEVVVFGDDGLPDFGALQRYNGKTTPISYCLFDLLWLDGKSMLDEPLESRKALLQKVIGRFPVLRYSESFDDGHALYTEMQNRGLEGIIAKLRGSVYIPGNRGSYWLKIPTRIRQEFVIGAYAESERGRAFRSLLFGAYNNAGQLEWIGRSGGGFKHKEMPAILARLKKLEIKKSPFVNKILDTKGAVIHYLKPVLVANFEFAAWTESGRIRKPATFLGFRTDKDPKTVVRELPTSVPKNTPQEEKRPLKKTSHAGKTMVSKKQHKYLNRDSNWKRIDEEQQDAEWLDFEMQHCTIPVHNLQRELWKDVPKGKLLIYYNQISSLILPYIYDRPQSLNLKLTHAGGPTTFLKDMENRQPDCAQIFTTKREIENRQKRNVIDYLVVNNAETLIYMIDLGCVDVNPWSSRVQHPKEPDYLWLDLDPTIPGSFSKSDKREAEEVGFNMAKETALAAHEVLKKFKLTSFVKTSGKTGMHIYIPCHGFSNAMVTDMAYKLAKEIHLLVPDITTLNRTVAQRGNNVYIDPEQNYYTKTLAAPYSIRPYHEPLVSAPLDWREVKPSLDRWAFNLNTMQDRLRKKGDLFQRLMDKKIAASNAKILMKRFGE